MRLHNLEEIIGQKKGEIIHTRTMCWGQKYHYL